MGDCANSWTIYGDGPGGCLLKITTNTRRALQNTYSIPTLYGQLINFIKHPRLTLKTALRSSPRFCLFSAIDNKIVIHTYMDLESLGWHS